MSWKSFHVNTYKSSSFFLTAAQYTTVQMYYSLFYFKNGHSGCFQKPFYIKYDATVSNL